jgi:hypothetical protein
MSDESLKQLVERLDGLSEKATPGEWLAYEFAGDRWFCLHGDGHDTSRGNEHDTRLTAALRNAWPTISKALRETIKDADNG